MKIAMLLSGGVDSSVALGLLREAGHRDVTAFYLKIWLEDEVAFLGDCPWETDLRFARDVCAHFEVPLEVLPLQAEYHRAIVDHALAELRAGRTPSPDIYCNSRIKFGVFWERVAARFDAVASGHYARVDAAGAQMRLLRAPDPVKDQTYFLSRLTQEQLRRVRFPIGHLDKQGVRELARRWNLPTKDRPDSQGICFLGKVKFPDFVRAHLGTRPGVIVDGDSGRVLGTHEGYWFYTIGQRQGLRLGGGPWYVVRREAATNTVVVAHANALSRHARTQFSVADVHWIAGAPPETGQLHLRIRHGPALTAAHVTPTPGGLSVVMVEADPGVAPGQSAVFYAGEVCLGSGIILE